MCVLYSERAALGNDEMNYVACTCGLILHFMSSLHICISLLTASCTFVSLISLISLAAFWIVWDLWFSLDLWLGHPVCFEICSMLTNFAFFPLCAFQVSKQTFIPLCEPGEIPWFAERTNWSQSVALNDEPYFYLSLSFIYLLLTFLSLLLQIKNEWSTGARDGRWRIED